MTEYQLEQKLINWFRGNGYEYIHGKYLTPWSGERESLKHTILRKRFINAIKRLNPSLTDAQAEEVYRKIIDLDSPDWNIKMFNFYKYLSEGVKISYRENGEEKSKSVRLIDFDSPENNDFLIVNQFEVEFQYSKGLRRPDFIVFINGLPLVIGELKSVWEGQNFRDAFKDHEEKKKDIPQLYTYAQVLVIADGYTTKVGSPTSGIERFFYWEGIESDDDLKPIGESRDSFIFEYKGEEITSLEALVRGLFNKERFIEYLRDFIVHEKTSQGYIKKIAMYHQFYAVKKAIERSKETIKAKKPEDKRIGVVWHTQGSGKSLTMLFYTKKALRELNNPLIVLITDRRELDQQLYETFSKYIKSVYKAESIEDLKKKLQTQRGGVLFVTIQKFSKKLGNLEPLNERHDIIVIADEAHRSQYRELAQNMRIVIPNASFMGFTATPIELGDRSTTAVFGKYISVYPMDKARRHGVVVPIMYETRLTKLHLTEEFINEDFEELEEDSQDEKKRRLFNKLESIILSAEDRLRKIAKDIVEHFNERDKEYKGKGMIVTLSRKIAVKLYDEIKKLPDAPSVEVVISGSKSRDEEIFHLHIRTKKELEELARRFKDPKSDPKLVIVVDMWLTGFDVPPLHVMYIDKPMKGHTLFQAIARVNRVYKGKPAGLIVDYIGITDDLAKALSIYAQEDIVETVTDLKEIIRNLKEKYDIVSSMLNGLVFDSNNEIEMMKAYERLTSDEKTKKKFVKECAALEKLYKIASHHPEAIKMKNDIKFFSKVRKMILGISKRTYGRDYETIEKEISELISQNIIADEPIDIFSLFGKDKAELTVFDEAFIQKLRETPYKNFAIDALSKILSDKIRIYVRRNPKRYLSLYEKIKEIIERYHNRILATAKILEELIRLSQELKNLIEEEKQFSPIEALVYDYLKDYVKNETNLRKIALALAEDLKETLNSDEWKGVPELEAKIRNKIREKLRTTLGYKYTQAKKIAEEMLNYFKTVESVSFI